MCVLCVVIFVLYFWYLSLKHTAPAINDTIYQSQCVFVYILSILFLSEKLTLQKGIAILLAFGGVALSVWPKF